jgi:uncharacterized membrane protein
LKHAADLAKGLPKCPAQKEKSFALASNPSSGAIDHVYKAQGIALATNPAASLRQLSNRTLLFLALSGIATGLSWLCYFRALQLGQASRVTPVDKLSVVFAIVLAAVVLGERLNWQHYVGGAFIVTGAVILAWA